MLVRLCDGPRATEVFLRYFAVHLRLYTSAANAWLCVVPFAVADVLGFGVFDRGRAGLEISGLGPDLCGLCCWVTLLRDGVSHGGFASTS